MKYKDLVRSKQTIFDDNILIYQYNNASFFSIFSEFQHSIDFLMYFEVFTFYAIIIYFFIQKRFIIIILTVFTFQALQVIFY